VETGKDRITVHVFHDMSIYCWIEVFEFFVKVVEL